MQRYAIYFAPEPKGALETFGSSWLRRDAYGHPVRPDSDMSRYAHYGAWTRPPARYGFHGTLKAPFRLKEGRSAGELANELEAFAASESPATAPPLGLTNIGDFIALCPGGAAGPQPEIDRLASRCVEHFEPFRAPLSEEDLSRRKPEALSERQRDYLDRFGYSYVMDEFRFHLTLTAPLDEPDRAQALEVLTPKTAAFAAQPFEIESLCLFADPGDGEPFKLVGRFALKA